MSKAIGLYSRKAGMSAEAFFQRYEYGHVPLVRELFASCFAAYTRNYPQREAGVAGEAMAGFPKLGFGALTQIWNSEGDDARTAVEVMAEADNARRLAEDEVQLFDRRSLLSFSVEERGAPPPDSAARLKVAALFARRPGVDPGVFRDYVEDALAPALRDLRSDAGERLQVACRRNHLIAGSVFHHPLYDAPTQAPPDVVLELWFRALPDLQAWAAAARVGSEGAAIPPDLGAAQAIGIVKEYGEPGQAV
jgi:hypothetical protein